MPGRFADADPILFDLDGTLTESGPGIISSVRYALAKMGGPVLDDQELRLFIGPPLLDSFRDVCGFDPAEVAVAIAAYREYYATDGQYENSVYDGIPELLTALREAGRTLAVATSKAEVFAASILDHFALTEYFTTVVGSELDGRRTAKSEIITEALARLDRPTCGDSHDRRPQPRRARCGRGRGGQHRGALGVRRRRGTDCGRSRLAGCHTGRAARTADPLS